MYLYFLALLMFNLFACFFTAIYWGYRKADLYLAYLPNCTTLIRQAACLKEGGAQARIHLIAGIAMTVTWPRFMSISDVISMEDIENFPRPEKIKLAALLWTIVVTFALLGCTWLNSKLAEYF